jgi:hypothetical protein
MRPSAALADAQERDLISFRTLLAAGSDEAGFCPNGGP